MICSVNFQCKVLQMALRGMFERGSVELSPVDNTRFPRNLGIVDTFAGHNTTAGTSLSISIVKTFAILGQ